MSLAALVFLVSMLVREGADPPARATVDVSPKDGVWVGQRVTLAITLATPDLFAGAPSFDLPSIPGAVVLPPSGSPTLGSESVGDTTFTTQRHEFAVYAQRAGIVQIPSFAIRFDSNAGYGKPINTRRVVTAPISFQAKTPPGAERLGTVIATRRLTLSDEWQPEPKAAKIGDAFTRTLTVTADDVPGMIFPPFRPDEAKGVAVYPEEPIVHDQTDRGRLRGERREVVTYLCEAPGTVTLPDRSITWYDLDADELKTETLPGRSFTIADAGNNGPDHDAADDPSAGSSNLAPRRWIIMIATGMVLLCGAFAFRLSRHFREVRSGSESADFARLRRACRADDPQAAYIALSRWLGRFGVLSLDDLDRLVEDPELSHDLASLEDRVYRPDGSRASNWDGKPLFALLALARRRLRHSPSTPADFNPLPPMNPVVSRVPGQIAPE